MAVDNLNGITICDGDMIRLDSNNLAVLFVSGIDGEVASPTTGLVHKPQIGEGGGKGGGNLAEGICAEVGEEVVQDWCEEEYPRREKGGDKHLAGALDVGVGERSIRGWDAWVVCFKIVGGYNMPF